MLGILDDIRQRPGDVRYVLCGIDNEDIDEELDLSNEECCWEYTEKVMHMLDSIFSVQLTDMEYDDLFTSDHEMTIDDEDYNPVDEPYTYHHQQYSNISDDKKDNTQSSINLDVDIDDMSIVYHKTVSIEEHSVSITDNKISMDIPSLITDVSEVGLQPMITVNGNLSINKVRFNNVDNVRIISSKDDDEYGVNDDDERAISSKVMSTIQIITKDQRQSSVPIFSKASEDDSSRPLSARHSNRKAKSNKQLFIEHSSRNKSLLINKNQLSIITKRHSRYFSSLSPKKYDFDINDAIHAFGSHEEDYDDDVQSDSEMDNVPSLHISLKSHEISSDMRFFTSTPVKNKKVRSESQYVGRSNDKSDTPVSYLSSVSASMPSVTPFNHALVQHSEDINVDESLNEMQSQLPAKNTIASLINNNSTSVKRKRRVSRSRKKRMSDLMKQRHSMALVKHSYGYSSNAISFLKDIQQSVLLEDSILKPDRKRKNMNTMKARPTANALILSSKNDAFMALFEKQIAMNNLICIQERAELERKLMEHRTSVPDTILLSSLHSVENQELRDYQHRQRLSTLKEDFQRMHSDSGISSIVDEEIAKKSSLELFSGGHSSKVSKCSTLDLIAEDTSTVVCDVDDVKSKGRTEMVVVGRADVSENVGENVAVTDEECEEQKIINEIDELSEQKHGCCYYLLGCCIFRNLFGCV